MPSCDLITSSASAHICNRTHGGPVGCAIITEKRKEKRKGLAHGAEGRGERVAGIHDFPLQGGVDRADEQLQPRGVQVLRQVFFAGDESHVRQSWLRTPPRGDSGAKKSSKSVSP